MVFPTGPSIHIPESILTLIGQASESQNDMIYHLPNIDRPFMQIYRETIGEEQASVRAAANQLYTILSQFKDFPSSERFGEVRLDRTLSRRERAESSFRRRLSLGRIQASGYQIEALKEAIFLARKSFLTRYFTCTLLALDLSLRIKKFNSNPAQDPSFQNPNRSEDLNISIASYVVRAVRRHVRSIKHAVVCIEYRKLKIYLDPLHPRISEIQELTERFSTVKNIVTYEVRELYNQNQLNWLYAVGREEPLIIPDEGRINVLFEL